MNTTCLLCSYTLTEAIVGHSQRQPDRLGQPMAWFGLDHCSDAHVTSHLLRDHKHWGNSNMGPVGVTIFICQRKIKTAPRELAESSF